MAAEQLKAPLGKGNLGSACLLDIADAMKLLPGY